MGRPAPCTAVGVAKEREEIIRCHVDGSFEETIRGARFENTSDPETIDLDLLLSFRIQSLTDEPEIWKKPIKPDRAR